MTTVVLRQVPGSSPIHRLWAGTKLIAVLLISVTIVVAPSWISIGTIVGLLLVAAIVARVPPTAIPRPPVWIWFLFLVGALVNLPIGVDAVLLFARSVVFAFVLLGASLMIGWTTSMSDIAPAVATLGAPLKKLRLPIDEWAATMALCLRSLPLLIEEMRTMLAARKLRPKSVLNSAADNSIIDLITAVMSIAIRRATEMGEAITARGGTGQITAYPARPRLPDAVALAVVALSCTAAVVLTFV
ncbi:energy-coupling factor transporter transmembrane component T family protein [Rhodococcus sp. P1Y]|uniref:energy-coupling factor transporter transmembrane component T family protein n=1 Tax=Rhodococcus sp. P1Y TaxID=1302308 RepID=UPI000EB5982E|nr:energy-coupling factor transporter transmembrane protein EcfT [Rhodococcus sp. P1Y]AYJ48654.1 energy-coupling factor transporter transmembrane protein EcfT [Rhodococcus sp. P1Y]